MFAENCPCIPSMNIDRVGLWSIGGGNGPGRRDLPKGKGKSREGKAVNIYTLPVWGFCGPLRG